VSRVWNVPGAAVLVTRSRQLQGELLASAQAHGLVRGELTARDIAVALWAVQGVLDVTRGQPVEAWRRHVDVLLAGLRPDPRSLPHPSLTDEEMTAVIRGQRPPAL